VPDSENVEFGEMGGHGCANSSQAEKADAHHDDGFAATRWADIETARCEEYNSIGNLVKMWMRRR
ncbi:MAG TPA: hypothetical protein VGP44_02315, partial [Gemmatimonadales bacterium]|nr:hypothetical protein [Gemmatimonadales bacterium]